MLKKRRNTFFYGIYLIIAVVILLEVALRAYFAVQIGPRVFAYGTTAYRQAYGDQRQVQLSQVYDRELADWEQDEATLNTVYTHRNAGGGYLKFFPNEKKFHKDVDTGEIFPVTINNHGFRGQEFSIEKPENVIRVLTLGASSTFGLWNRDDETYPVQMEQMLNDRCAGPKRFEVINFAIPHAISDQILALFIAEGLALKPDIITFYEGRNDSNQLHPMEFRGGRNRNDNPAKTKGAFSDLWYELAQRLVLARFIDEMTATYRRISAAETRRSLDRIAERTSREFLVDLRQLHELAKQHNILFVVANQQANSKSWFGLPKSERFKLKGIAYQDEVAQIRALLEQGESISGYEFNFLIHDRLMRNLEEWVRHEKLPFVDIIGLLDQERHHMMSWVHLDPYANERVAGAFTDEIARHLCPRRQ